MEKKMKRLLTVLIAALLLVPAFAQTTVDEGKLVKTLEKNKDEDASFASEIDLSRMKVYSDGEVSIPLFAKSKVNIVSDIDMIDIEIRMSNARKSRFNVLFKVKDIRTKTIKATSPIMICRHPIKDESMRIEGTPIILATALPPISKERYFPISPAGAFADTVAVASTL